MGLGINYPKSNYYTTVTDTYNGLGAYPVQELSLKMKLLLLFRRKHRLSETLNTHKSGNCTITYSRYSTYKLYKKEKIWLSSYISCNVHFKVEEDEHESKDAEVL